MKCKAFRIEPECVDYENYFDFDGWEDFIIDGNDDYSKFHTDYDLYFRIKKYCIDYNDLQEAIDDIDSEYSYYKNVTEAIEDYLGFTPSKKQVHDIKATLQKPESHSCFDYYSDDERIADLLTICEKREWTTGTIRGCCQGDWQTVFYPVDRYDDDFINWIESVYFGTGEEYAICCYEDGEEFDAPYECDDAYYDYFQSNVTWNEDLLKKAISKETGVDPGDITLYDPECVTETIWHAA